VELLGVSCQLKALRSLFNMQQKGKCIHQYKVDNKLLLPTGRYLCHEKFTMAVMQPIPKLLRAIFIIHDVVHTGFTVIFQVDTA